MFGDALMLNFFFECAPGRGRGGSKVMETEGAHRIGATKTLNEETKKKSGRRRQVPAIWTHLNIGDIVFHFYCTERAIVVFRYSCPLFPTHGLFGHIYLTFMLDAFLVASPCSPGNDVNTWQKKSYIHKYNTLCVCVRVCV